MPPKSSRAQKSTHRKHFWSLSQHTLTIALLIKTQFFGNEEHHSTRGCIGGKRAAIRLTQRLDGFLSLDAGDEGGIIITRPFVFEGDELILNADASKLGNNSFSPLSRKAVF